MAHKLSGEVNEKWVIDDFRKLSHLFARNLVSSIVQEFFSLAHERFGGDKVKNFMEIQLMNNQQEYNSFMTWFNSKFGQPSAQHEVREQPIKM